MEIVDLEVQPWREDGLPSIFERFSKKHKYYIKSVSLKFNFNDIPDKKKYEIHKAILNVISIIFFIFQRSSTNSHNINFFLKVHEKNLVDTKRRKKTLS